MTALVGFVWFLLPTLVTSSPKMTCSHLEILEKDLRPDGSPFQNISHVDSRLLCGKLCTVDHPSECRGYGYKEETRECFLYASTSTATVPGANDGVIFVQKLNEYEGIGYVCLADEDCKGSKMECRDSTCQCEIGYHYHPCSQGCVGVCPNGYGNGYYTVEDKCLNENNDVSDNLNQDQCWAKCSADPQCRSFEVGSTLCHISYTTMLEQPDDWKDCASMNYFQRHCA